MKTKKKSYEKPVIASEKVFEQSALACGHVAFVPQVPPLTHMKTDTTTCGYNSS